MSQSHHKRTRADGKRQSRLAFSKIPDSPSASQNDHKPPTEKATSNSMDLDSYDGIKSQSGITRASSSSSSIFVPEVSSPTRSQPPEADSTALSNPVSTPSDSGDIVTRARKPNTRSSIVHSNNTLVPFSPPSALQSQLDIFNDEESGDSDDDDVVTPAAKRRRSTSKPTADSGENLEVVQVERKKPTPRRRRRASSFIDDDSSGEKEEEAEEVPRSSKKRRRRSVHREKEDLKEDLEFLRTSEPPGSPEGIGNRDRRPNSRQQALEALKKRRSSRQEQNLQQGENFSSVAVVYGDDKDNCSSAGSPLQSEDDLMQMDADELDQNDENLVVEDEEDQEPVRLPLLFSNYQSRKTKDLFKLVIEWMVQKKLNPGFAMHDEVYTFAFRRVNDMAIGLGNSKFQSSAWTSEFTKVLQARPEIDYIRFVNTEELHDRCDACNRGNHPATFEVTFKGRPYNQETLERLSDDEEGSSNSDDDLPDEDTVYCLGRHCMENARVAHSLVHWKYHLNEWAVDYLVTEGHCAPEKLVERDSWSTNRRSRYANEVVDKMEADGEIEKLYREFKDELEQAQYSTQGTYTRY